MRTCKIVFRMKDGGRFERLIQFKCFRDAATYALGELKNNPNILEIVSVRVKGKPVDNG